MNKSLLIAVAYAVSCLGASAQVVCKQLELLGGSKASHEAYLKQPHRLFPGVDYFPADVNATMIELTNSKISYVFKLQRTPIDAQYPSKEPTTSFGLCAPTLANWSSFQLLEIGLNDKTSLDKCPVESLDLVEGKTGSFKIRWKHPDALVTATMALADGDDKLMMEVDVKPAEGKTLETYTVNLCCYPSSFAGGYEQGKALRAREAMTATRTLRMSDKALLAKEEPWVLFYDNHFDVELNRGEGPCSFLYNPDDAAKCEIEVTNYPCYARITYPIKNKAYLLLWEFKGAANKVAKEYMSGLKCSFTTVK